MRLRLHSFPTRRSSDLGTAKDSCLIVHFDPANRYRSDAELLDETKPWYSPEFVNARTEGQQFKTENLTTATYGSIYSTRSEEHTSELQSRENLVCRLLL